MATIKFKRGTGQPTGLTAYEPAWDTTNNRLFIKYNKFQIFKEIII